MSKAGFRRGLSEEIKLILFLPVTQTITISRHPIHRQAVHAGSGQDFLIEPFPTTTKLSPSGKFVNPSRQLLVTLLGSESSWIKANPALLTDWSEFLKPYKVSHSQS